MPKVRSSSDLAVEFGISPWRSKKRRYKEEKHVQDASAAGLGSEARTEADLCKVQSASDGHAPASTDASVKAAILQPPLAADTWTGRCKEKLGAKFLPAGQEILVCSIQPASNSTDSNASLAVLGNHGLESGLPPGMRAALEQVLRQHQSTEAAAAKSSGPQLFEEPPPSLEGPAWLAWLPDGSVTGEVTSSSGDTVISIRGKEVISERECTRDAEWKLLHVSLQRSSVCQEVKLFVEKTGCDAAILSAPFPLHGTEAGLLQDAALTSESNIHLSFSCNELLYALDESSSSDPGMVVQSDTAAEEALAVKSPHLQKQGGIVNMGAFTCSGSGLAVLEQPRASTAHCELYDSDLDA